MEDAVRFHLQARLSVEELGLLWRDLESRADITFFLSWDWMSAWLAELGIEPLVLVGEAGGRLILLGIVVPRRRVEGGIVRVNGLCLHATGRRELDVIAHEYNGFLVDRTWVGRVERAAVSYLLSGISAGKRRLDELHIVAMLNQDREALTPPGALVQLPSRKPSWRVDLDAVRTFGKPYLDTLSANTRQQIRRAMRFYEERGPLVAERAGDVPTALAYLDGLKDLHQAQWTARGEPGGFAFPFFEAFQRRLVAGSLPHDGVELTRIAAGDATIGYLYNLVCRGHVLAFMSGFRFEDDARAKPGLVSHALCIQRHVAAGARLYDFLAGAARYKASLGRPGPEFVYLLLQRRTPMTSAEHELRRVWDRLTGIRRRILQPRRNLPDVRPGVDRAGTPGPV